MNPGIRTVRSMTFAACALFTACGQVPDPAQLTAVDQLITATDAAVLTLNELDRSRYARMDSLFAGERTRFDARFADTLGRDAAGMLGSQFILLRAAGTMGKDHERVLARLIEDSERLRWLRNDLANNALDAKEAAPLIAQEQRQHADVISGVHAVMDNYRLVQHAWDRADSVATLLADTEIIARP